MGDKNFLTFIDFGNNAIRATTFNKETEKVENQLALTIKNDKSNYLSNKDKLIEDLIFNLEKKNGEYLDEISLMVDSSDILFISLLIYKKSDSKILNNNFLKYITDEAKYEISKNYPNYEIVHSIIKNFYLDEKKFSKLPKNLSHNKFAVEFNFFVYPKLFLENLRKIFAKQNVIIKKFIFSSYSKSIFYLNQISDQKKIIFVDIGFEKTCAFLFEDNKMQQFKILPIGGNHITKDLSKILNIDMIKAEKIKLCFDKNEKVLIEENLSLDLVRKIIFARIEEILELCIQSIKLNHNLDQTYQYQLNLIGDGSKILDNKFKEKIVFSKEIDLLEETPQDICEAALKLSEGINKQEVVIIPKKQMKMGFFEKLFHFFK